MNASETDGKEEFVLFCDNLSTQTNELLYSEVRKINGRCWLGMAGITDIWQAVDYDSEHMLQTLFRTMQDEWLQSDNHIDIWLPTSEEKIDVKRQHVLITH